MFELTPFFRTNRAFATFDPFKEMEELEKQFFGRQLPAYGYSNSRPGFRTDVRENDKEYILDAELPGFSKEDIGIEIKNGYLTIKAERKSDSEEKDEKNNYIRRERCYGSFSRSFDLEGIDSENISASYKDGILSLTLPKAAPLIDEGRKIEIR